MSELKERLQNDLTTARKARDRQQTETLSMTLSEIRNREIDLGKELADTEVQDVVASAVKRRKEAASQMRDGGRADLAEKEDREAELLQTYLPEQLSEEQVRLMIRDLMESGVTDLGPLMGQLMPRLKGRFDGKVANRLVREEFGA